MAKKRAIHYYHVGMGFKALCGTECGKDIFIPIDDKETPRSKNLFTGKIGGVTCQKCQRIIRLKMIEDEKEIRKSKALHEAEMLEKIDSTLWESTNKYTKR